MFKQMVKQKYPPRLWGLTGYPGGGKSTFAAQMRGPLLVVDADHRFQEVFDLAVQSGRVVYELSNVPSDNVDTDRITERLTQGMPGAEVGTIVVDSLTAIIAPLVTQAIQDKAAGRIKNQYAGWKNKAIAMRQLQDAVTRWGTDSLWIYHLNDSKDANGRDLVKSTVSKTELARLTRSLNMQLEIVQNGSKRGIKVVWARRGRSGMTLWDETGTWAGMPERIESAVYDGLTREEQERIAQEAPEVFPNPETAIAWAVDQKAFESIPHARNAYDKLKRESDPETAQEMAALWVADVRARLGENK